MFDLKEHLLSWSPAKCAVAFETWAWWKSEKGELCLLLLCVHLFFYLFEDQMSATIFCNNYHWSIFHDVAYKAKDRSDLLAGIDEFLDQVTVLPPGEWDPSIRIEPPKSVPSQVHSYDDIDTYSLGLSLSYN